MKDAIKELSSNFMMSIMITTKVYLTFDLFFI